MKKFLAKSAVFLVIGFILLNSITWMLFSYRPYRRSLNFYDIFLSSERADRKISSSLVMLGDSVGGQLFPHNLYPNSLTTNGDVLAAGYYILARNAIQNNPDLKYVILASVPNVIGHKFERPQTYNYFLKPFYTLKDKKFFSDLIYDKINKKPVSHLVILPMVRYAKVFSDINFNNKIPMPGWVLSDVALEYFQKLKELVEENKITLFIIAPPVPAHWKTITSDWKQMKEQIRKNNLESIFSGYFENIIYLENDKFKDGLHLKKNFLTANYPFIVKRLVPDKNVMDELVRVALANKRYSQQQPVQESTKTTPTNQH